MTTTPQEPLTDPDVVPSGDPVPGSTPDPDAVPGAPDSPDPVPAPDPF